MSASQTIERRDLKNSEPLLKYYASEPEILGLIENAEFWEKCHKEGIPLVADTLKLTAELNSETGLWEMCVHADHGKVLYTIYDKDITKINITTIPDVKYIEMEGGDDGDIALAQKDFSNSYNLDLTDLLSVKRAKEYFQDDYVLRNIQLDNPTLDTADRMVIWHIRAYKKLFRDYYRSYSFLWERTEYKNARSLAAAMREKSLLS